MLTGVAGSRFKRSPLTMGLSKTKFTTIFRTKFKDALMAANAQGFGRALMAAGSPIAGWVQPHDEDELQSWDYHKY